MSGPRRRSLGAALVFALGLTTSPARSEQTRLATTSPSELERGEAQGIAVTSRGRLFLAPRITPHGKVLPGAFPSQVFGAGADEAGNVFLATGPDGQIVKITRAG